MSFDPSVLRQNPAPAPSVSPVPGMVLIRSVQITHPNWQQATSLASLTIDAPMDATFAKYRRIIFQFLGIGLANATGTHIQITPRRSNQNIGGTMYYQQIQASSTTATGWVNTSVTATFPITNSVTLTNSTPVNTLDISMYPMGLEANYVIGSGNAALLAGAIGKAIVSYPVTGNTMPSAMNENPGITLSLSAANYFTSWTNGVIYNETGIVCDIYGFLKT